MKPTIMCCVKIVFVESENANYADMVFCVENIGLTTSVWVCVLTWNNDVRSDKGSKVCRRFILASGRLPNTSSMFVRIGDFFDIEN